MNFRRLLKRLLDEVIGRLLVKMNGDRKLTRFDVDAGRRIPEKALVGGEILDAECRRHDDQLERRSSLPSQRHDAREQADENVRIDAALVGFVDDDDAVVGEQEIALNFL